MRRIVAIISFLLLGCFAAVLLFVRAENSPDLVSTTVETAVPQEDLKQMQADLAQLQEQSSAAQERIRQLEKAAVEAESMVGERKRLQEELSAAQERIRKLEEAAKALSP